jgi:hypothetical protein
MRCWRGKITRRRGTELAMLSIALPAPPGTLFVAMIVSISIFFLGFWGVNFFLGAFFLIIVTFFIVYLILLQSLLVNLRKMN